MFKWLKRATDPRPIKGLAEKQEATQKKMAVATKILSDFDHRTDQRRKIERRNGECGNLSYLK